MKKIITILFFSIYLFYISGFKELIRINVLVQHFHETKKIDPAVSFIQYLVMHYLTDDLNDIDNDRDKQLPFKSAETCVLNATLIYIPTPIINIDFNSFAVAKKEFIALKDLSIYTGYHTLVWHPPQYA